MPLIYVAEAFEKSGHRCGLFSRVWPQMYDRSKIVTLMLTTARQIAASETFASDAMYYANMAQDFEDIGAAGALREQVIARRVEIFVMRGIMADLACALGRMPIEAE